MHEIRAASAEMTDSVVAGTVRSFEMPARRLKASNSNMVLVVVLLGIMLAAAALLVWCAFIPRSNADAIQATQVTVLDEGDQGLENASTRLTSARASSIR